MTFSRPLVLGALLITGILGTSCGSSPAGQQPRNAAADSLMPSMATSLADAGGTWAVTLMGGSAAQHNNFWELFVRRGGSRSWELVTPEGAADNGGLVVADFGRGSLAAGVDPSQNLVFSPLSVTGDHGASWEPASPLSPDLASVPGALAGSPGGNCSR